MTDIFKAPSREQTAQQAADSLPVGRVWRAKNKHDSNMRKLINSIAPAHNAAQQKIEEIAYEFNINNTSDLLSEWETSVGLPDSCFDGITGSLSARRASVIERLKRTPLVSLAQLQSYVDFVFPDLAVELVPAITLTTQYPDTVGNNLTVTNDDAYEYSNTTGNDLTISATASPDAYIAATLGDDIVVSVQVYGPPTYYQLNPTTYNFVGGDVGKTVVFIDAFGNETMRFKIGATGFGTSTFCTLTGGTYQGNGTYTGGTWGFSTETVVTPGAYTLTADSAYFDSGDVGSTINKIDTSGNVTSTFEIKTYIGTTSVTASLTSGPLPSSPITGGLWDFSTETATASTDYTLETGSAYFAVGNIGDTIRTINAAGSTVTEYDISAFTSDTEVTATVSSGSAVVGTVAGGLWDWDTATLDNDFTADKHFILVANVVGLGETFEYDFEVPFSNGINVDKLECVLNKILPANVILLIQYVEG